MTDHADGVAVTAVEDAVQVVPVPTSTAILIQLKGGDTGYQAGELPEAFKSL